MGEGKNSRESAEPHIVRDRVREKYKAKGGEGWVGYVAERSIRSSCWLVRKRRVAYDEMKGTVGRVK